MADRNRIQQLFTSHAGQVRDFLRRRLARASDAQDISQEVFLRMMRVEDLSSIRDPQGYLFTVANNLRREQFHTDGLARRRTQVPLEMALEEPELEVHLTAAADMDQDTQLRQLDRAVRNLSDRDRTVLSLRYVENLSYRDIAQRLGWSSKTAVERALAGALARCREQFDRTERV